MRELTINSQGERPGRVMNQIKTLTNKNLTEGLEKVGCGECQTSCQSACKTSCTVANQKCERGQAPLSFVVE